MKFRFAGIFLLTTTLICSISNNVYGNEGESYTSDDLGQVVTGYSIDNPYSNNSYTTTTNEEYRTRLINFFPGIEKNDYLNESEIAEKEILNYYLPAIIESRVNKSKSITSYADPENKYVSGEVICSANSMEEAQRVANAYGGQVESCCYGVAVIKLPDNVNTAMALVASANYETNLPPVWPNECYYANVYDESITESEATSENGSSEALESSQNVKKTKGLRQWMHTVLGSIEAWKSGYKGQQVNVAIIDTGINEAHIDISANCLPGINFTDEGFGEENHIDFDGHGTHVAGIVAADDNKKLGTGVAPDSNVRGYRVFNEDGNGTAANVIRAVNAATDEGIYSIINLSLGGYSYNNVFAKATKRAYENGIIVFAAAGNEALSGSHYPSDYEGVFSVASVNKKGHVSNFSNYGSSVDFAFPGEDIYSLDSKNIKKYKYESGTSMATAVASGVAAVIISSDENYLNNRSSETVDEVINIMKKYARKRDSDSVGRIATFLPKALKLIK